MQRREIKTDNAPAPVGPYSQAIEVNGTLYCSGQIALDPKNGHMQGSTPAAQMTFLMKNVEAVLSAAGMKFENIVKTTIFLTDMKAFPEVNSAYEKALGGHRPARSTVEASALPKGALVEVECIAVK